MYYAIAVVVALICDQVLKRWVTEIAAIPLDTGMRELLPGVLRITHIHNTGAAFSLLEGANWLFIPLAILFALAVVWALVKQIIATPGARWAAVFVMAGALGNCIDRILHGYVVDMLQFEFIRFPVFNLADCYVVVGAIVFCICLLVEKPPAKEHNVPVAAPTILPPVSPEPAPARRAPMPSDPAPAPKAQPVRPVEASPKWNDAEAEEEQYTLEDILSEFEDRE